MAMYLGSNKVEIGQSSGGGSSDFSTAKVTFTSTFGEYSVLGYTITSEAPLTITFPLLDLQMGNMSAYFLTADMFNHIVSEPVLTGGVQFSGSLAMISGDGTFTASGTNPS